MNTISRARAEVEHDPQFIDLIDTNYHRCGFHYPTERVEQAALDYFRRPESHRYSPDPHGSIAAREVIAGFHHGQGVPCTPDDVLVTASSSESYSLLFTTLASPGCSVILPRPTYPLFEDLAGRAGLETRFYSLREADRWQPDTDELVRRIDDATAMVVLISPNNPTGSIVSRENAQRILTAAAERNVVVVTDEVFAGVVFDPERAPMVHPGALTGTDGPLVITINGASKLFAAPDLKLSWMIAGGPHASRAPAVEALAVANDLYLNCSSLSQALVPALFAGREPTGIELVGRLAQSRAVVSELVESCEALSMTPPAGGIHATIAVDPTICPLNDEELVVELLRRQEVALHPGYLYGIDDRPYLIASLLPPAERLREGWQRVVRFLDQF